MSLCTISLAAGGAAGSAVVGLISIREDWRVIYYVGTGILGLLVLLIALSMPETAYRRESQSNPDPADEIGDISKTGGLVAHVEGNQQREETASKAPWRQSLNMFTGRKTEESLWLIFIRPVVMLVIPPVLWAILVLGVNVGFTVAISTSVASSFTVVYGFTTWHIGLVWLSNLIGCVLGMPFAGKLSDRVADMFTRRNGGIREGEMRLPTMVIGMVLMPVSIILYGLGLNYQLHWIVPTIALGICELKPPPITIITSAMNTDLQSSRLLPRHSRKCLTGLHRGCLPSHCWRGRCDADGLQT